MIPARDHSQARQARRASPRAPRYPPPGQEVRTLPPGQRIVRVRRQDHHYFDGVFCRPVRPGAFVVVNAPLGARVGHLPSDDRIPAHDEGVPRRPRRHGALVRRIRTRRLPSLTCRDTQPRTRRQGRAAATVSPRRSYSSRRFALKYVLRKRIVRVSRLMSAADRSRRLENRADGGDVAGLKLAIQAEPACSLVVRACEFAPPGWKG
jgi:hypothetical protein